MATFGQFQVKLGNFWFQRLVTLLTTNNNNNGSGNWSQSSFFSLQVVSNFRLVFLLSIPSLSLNNFTWRDVSFLSPRRNPLEHVLTTLTSTKFKQVKQTNDSSTVKDKKAKNFSPVDLKIWCCWQTSWYFCLQPKAKDLGITWVLGYYLKFIKTKV